MDILLGSESVYLWKCPRSRCYRRISSGRQSLGDIVKCPYSRGYRRANKGRVRVHQLVNLHTREKKCLLILFFSPSGRTLEGVRIKFF